MQIYTAYDTLTSGKSQMAERNQSVPELDPIAESVVIWEVGHTFGADAFSAISESVGRAGVRNTDPVLGCSVSWEIRGPWSAKVEFYPDLAALQVRYDVRGAQHQGPLLLPSIPSARRVGR